METTFIFLILFIYFPIIFIIYYIKEVIEKPRLYYKPNEWNQRLLPTLRKLHVSYFPTIWCFNRHLMLALLLFRESRSKEYFYDQIEHLTMKDGGITGLAWTGLENLNQRSNVPIVVIFHTISGDEQDVKNIVIHIKEKMDCAVVVCIRRGHGNLPLKTPVINTMGSTDDLKIQLTHIKRKYPNSKILGVGISAGSGLLARYLGEVGAKSLLFAAVAISPAYDIEKAFHRIHPIYNKLMAQRLINYFLERHYLSLSEIPGYNHVKDSKSIGEFQDRLHLLSGYASKEEYYHYSNPIKVANLIQTPLLILNADDDPICVKLNVNENLHWLEGLTKTILVKTKRGSHIAFFEGFRARSWCDELVTDYFIEVLKT